MKKELLVCFIIVMSLQLCYAQKSIEKLSHYKIDSLHHINVDTILYYHSYCGECEILGKKHICQADYGYTLIDNVIIYCQNGNFYSLDFDCYNLPIKKQLDSCKSIPYSISIISALNARDKTIKAMYKKGQFFGPLQADGGFENVDIYFSKITQHIAMSESEKTDPYKIYKKYPWMDSQTNLLKLIALDIKMKK